MRESRLVEGFEAVPATRSAILEIAASFSIAVDTSAGRE
jgi:hypothetical protein